MIVIAFFAGRLASRFLARRAAHLDPLQALPREVAAIAKRGMR